MKHAPNYFEYWSDPKHDWAHQIRQHDATCGERYPFIIRMDLAEFEMRAPTYYAAINSEKQA